MGEVEHALKESSSDPRSLLPSTWAGQGAVAVRAGREYPSPAGDTRAKEEPKGGSGTRLVGESRATLAPCSWASGAAVHPAAGATACLAGSPSSTSRGGEIRERERGEVATRLVTSSPWR